ncbi:MAG TPA: prepilin-type N-terminal cleavage/methylation domain-containing protein [Pseudomonadales bacterium]|nr:prepilin-type N-terminal cleavage/methylation domain-containing protein [Pseudomonadales bacterium]
MQNRQKNKGFTLIELLVVIAIIAILAAILMPVLRAAKERALSANCMSNKKQLQIAAIMYTTDNNDLLPFNPDQSVTNAGALPWVSGKMDWTSGSDNTNIALLVNSAFSGLAGYTSTQPLLYHCPADIYLKPGTQTGLGWGFRVRSVAMDAAIGGGNPTPSAPGGKPASSLVGFYPKGMFYATKASQLRNPGPSDSWVFTDEHPDSIDDGILYVSPLFATTGGAGVFTELPSSLHDRADGLSFADGHAEIHKWLDGRTCPPVRYQSTSGWSGLNMLPTPNQDLLWMAQHTPDWY